MAEGDRMKLKNKKMNSINKNYMKKPMVLLFLMILSIAMISGCSKKDSSKEANTADSTETSKDNTITGTSEEINASAEETNDSAKESIDNTAEKVDITIAALKGPTSMGMAKIMDDAAHGTASNNYKFTIAGTPDEITGGLLKGDYHIAAIPCNLASVLYNKSKGQVVVAGINTLGVLYVVENGTTINSISDLKGKTIYSTGKGSTPEYTLRYLLSSSGIDPDKDVSIEYKSEATEVAALLSKKANTIAMLPQPYVTTVMMSNKNIRIALDVTEEWNKLSNNGSTVVTGVYAVNKKFLDSNKAAVDAFLSECATSTDYVNENIDEAAALIEKYGIFKAAVAKNAIPKCNITFIQGDDMKTKINGYLDVLYQQNPNAVGGTLPDDAFYYTK